ncbi:MAG: toprim domain-containing protein [Proteobacteria bacterium]|nr:toprim domain-containing protein [Pseudomonadota bacterium]
MTTSAEGIARALGNAKRNGKGWTCPCPVPGHGRGRGDRTPSLSVSDGRNGVLVHCHGGCPQTAVIDALKARNLWDRKTGNSRGWAANVAKVAKVLPDDDNGEHARTLWRQSLPADGTPVQTYLRHRGFTGPIPPTLRFLFDARHPSNNIHPALIAAVTLVPSRRVMAVHRTFLAPDGLGKAPVEPNKMALGPIGGGAVRLAPAGEMLAVAEGIETALSVMDATGIPAWAAISAGGIKALILPLLPMAADVVICADNDGAGVDAANEAAERWTAEGRRVRIALPPTGKDFNDLATLTEMAA